MKENYQDIYNKLLQQKLDVEAALRLEKRKKQGIRKYLDWFNKRLGRHKKTPR